MKIPILQTTDPIAHVQNVAHYIHELKKHCVEDAEFLDERRSKVLLETTAEVLGGLERAFDDFTDQMSWLSTGSKTGPPPRWEKPVRRTPARRL